MSSNELAGLMAEYALGTLEDDAERDRVRALTESDPGHATEVVALQTTLANLAFALAPIAPLAETRARLLASTKANRFSQFADKFAAMFDVTVTRAKQLLDWVDDPSRWEAGPGEGTTLIHFTAGPACAGADNGFVRVKPGVVFPWHGHTGNETTLVLQGACVDSDGSSYERGDLFVNRPGSQHEFRNADNTNNAVDFIYAVCVFGVDFDAAKPNS